MNGDMDFVRSLSEFLALHTEQSSGYLNDLIKSFLRGAVGRSELEPSAKNEIIKRLRAEIEMHNDVPSNLENYLLKIAKQDLWPAHATAIASRYLCRQSSERFIAWQRRQQLIAEQNRISEVIADRNCTSAVNSIFLKNTDTSTSDARLSKMPSSTDTVPCPSTR